MWSARYRSRSSSKRSAQPWMIHPTFRGAWLCCRTCCENQAPRVWRCVSGIAPPGTSPPMKSLPRRSYRLKNNQGTGTVQPLQAPHFDLTNAFVVCRYQGQAVQPSVGVGGAVLIVPVARGLLSQRGSRRGTLFIQLRRKLVKASVARRAGSRSIAIFTRGLARRLADAGAA